MTVDSRTRRKEMTEQRIWLEEVEEGTYAIKSDKNYPHVIGTIQIKLNENTTLNRDEVFHTLFEKLNG